MMLCCRHCLFTHLRRLWQLNIHLRWSLRTITQSIFKIYIYTLLYTTIFCCLMLLKIFDLFDDRATRQVPKVQLMFSCHSLYNILSLISVLLHSFSSIKKMFPLIILLSSFKVCSSLADFVVRRCKKTLNPFYFIVTLDRREKDIRKHLFFEKFFSSNL